MSLQEHIKDLINAEPADTQLLSIRLPTTIINQVDELAADIRKIRSDLVTSFIKAGIDELIKQLGEEKENTIELATTQNNTKRYFLLNTNYNNSKVDHYKMIENGEASAFYNWRKEYIEHLKEGDHVFLYQSRHGICGYGKADIKLLKLNHEGNKNECYTRKLNKFTRNFKPLTAKACKDITKSNIVFRNTMVPLTTAQGEAIAAEIIKRSN